MRKIEQRMAEAFRNKQTFKSGNTEVLFKAMTNDGQYPKGDHFLVVELFGKEIVRQDSATGVIEVTHAGWPTATTKSRLNAIGAGVHQSNFIWYIDGKEWGGSWTAIAAKY
jgi:hypothetical protein